jgi:hypothetical protein
MHPIITNKKIDDAPEPSQAVRFASSNLFFPISSAIPQNPHLLIRKYPIYDASIYGSKLENASSRKNSC